MSKVEISSNIYSESEIRFLNNYINRERPELSYEEIVSRLNQHEPIDYILEYTYFYQLKIEVNPSTLIPRPETEELVDLILKEYPKTAKIKILDIGTGSGCISLALKKNLPLADVTAIDISEKAIEKARKNAESLRLDIQFLSLDIFDKVQWSLLKNYDLIVSNPPYIARSEKPNMSESVLNYEPKEALFVESSDPFIFYKQILNFGEKHLKNGVIYFETNQNTQLENYQEWKIEKIKDASGNWRFLRCEK